MANTVLAWVSPLREPLTPKPTLNIKFFNGLLTGIPRGAITEILGPASSGRTTALHSILTAATRSGEVCAIVDTGDSFDPASARDAGADLSKLLWVQCGHQLETAMRAADLILHAGGFGLVALDLCDARDADLRRIPTSHWYRFQRAVENTPAVFAVLAAQSNARSCAACQIDLRRGTPLWRGNPPFRFMESVRFDAGLRKPPSGARVTLEAAAGG